MNGYDLLKMQELLKDFHRLTGIKICMYDDSGLEICYYPEKHTPFCKLLRENEQLDRKCVECDRRAMDECKKTHRQYRYICHAGLLECVSPILYGENVIGYIGVGQIRTQESQFSLQTFSGIGENQIEKLQEKYEQLPLFDPDKIKSAIRILDICASYEYLKGVMNTTTVAIDARLEHYINSHLRSSLSVQELCTHFRLSRNELYSVFRNYFNDSPAEYIKKRRLHRACEYLTQTDLPVNIIAQKCGIPDYNYFSKIFKRAFALSPTAYRKTH